MKKLNLHSKSAQAFIEIPVDFIDSYLPEAPEEALKVYLYLLRSALDPSIILSLQDMADLFDVTPKKISQALAYWESLHVLSLEYSDGEITDITILPFSGKQAVSERHSESVFAKSQPESNESSQMPQNITPLRPTTEVKMPISLDHPVVQNLAELAQWYMKKPVTNTMLEAIAVCFAALNENEAMCEFLLEYCIERGHTSPHYMKAVAQGWAKEGFTDVSEVKQAVANRDKGLYAVMKELGLGNRDAAPQEAEIIRKWLSEFELDIVCEACRRTIANIHEPKLSYVNGILSDWKEHNVTTLTEVEALDKQHEEKKAEANKDAQPQKKNSFHNGMERTNDYESLMKLLVES